MAKGWRGSDDDGRSAGGYHEHGTGLTDGLVVDVDAYDSVGTEDGSALHHLVDGCVLGLDEHFLVRAAAAAEEVGEACHEVLDSVGTDDGFARDDAFVLANGMSFDGWGGGE